MKKLQITHNEFTQRARKFIPLSESMDSGRCHGLAYGGMLRGILADMMDAFDNLLDLISKINTEGFGEISSLLWDEVGDDKISLTEEELEKKRQEKLDLFNKKYIKEEHNLKLEWQDLIEIEKFLKEVSQFHDPSNPKFAHLFKGNRRPKSQMDSDLFFPLLLPAQLVKEQQNVHRTMSFSGPYNKEDLQAYFKTFPLSYSSSQYGKSEKQIGLLLGNRDHSIAIGYNPKYIFKPWIIIDAQGLREDKYFDTSSIFNYVFEILLDKDKADKYVFFNTKVYLITHLNFEESKSLFDGKGWAKHPDITNPEIAKRTSMNGNSWIWTASKYGDKDQVKALIKSAPSLINQKINSSGSTPVCVAAEYGHVGVVDAFIDANADLNLGDNKGSTPLHCAVEEGHMEVVKLLIINKEKLHINQANDDGLTPLWIATQNNQSEMINILLEHGAEIDENIKGTAAPFVAINKNNIAMMKLFIDRKVDMSQMKWINLNPLRYAMFNNNTEIVKLLIDNMDTVKLSEEQGESLLYYFASEGNLEIAELLIERGAKVNHTTSFLNLTPLSIAVSRGHLEMTEYLLSKGADINHADGNGLTPIFNAVKAAKWDRFQMIELLFLHDPCLTITFSVDQLNNLVRYNELSKLKMREFISDRTGSIKITLLEFAEIFSFEKVINLVEKHMQEKQSIFEKTQTFFQNKHPKFENEERPESFVSKSHQNTSKPLSN